MGKKIIKPDEKVGINLTQAQRSLLIEAMLLIPKEVEQSIRSTPASEPLMFTLDDLDDLAGHVAAGANHAEDRASRDKLDRIYRKIEKVLASFSDQAPTAAEEAPSSIIETLIDMITGSGPTILPMPARSKKGEELYPIKLTKLQREALIGATRLRRGLKNKIGEVPEGTQVVGFTRKELDETAGEVDIAIGFAPAPYMKRLEAVLVKLEDILDALQEDEQIRPGRKGAEKDDRIYQLKITLKDIKPPVWRRVLVPDCPLTRLHEVIQVAMGWDDCHLYDFEVQGERYTDPRGMADLEMGDASKVRLGQVAPREKAKFRYTYDFGDNWRHEVLVEEVLPREPGRAYPACIDGRRACPPEDVGGPWGYREFIEAINDPAHERHGEFMEWRAGFGPEAFDPDAVNERLKGILR